MVLLCKGTNKQAKSQNYSCLFRRKLPGRKNMAQGIGSRSTEHRPTLHVASAYAPRSIGLRSTLCKPLPQQGRKKGALVKANAPVGGGFPESPGQPEDLSLLSILSALKTPITPSSLNAQSTPIIPIPLPALLASAVSSLLPLPECWATASNRLRAAPLRRG